MKIIVKLGGFVMIAFNHVFLFIIVFKSVRSSVLAEGIFPFKT